MAKYDKYDPQKINKYLTKIPKNSNLLRSLQSYLVLNKYLYALKHRSQHIADPIKRKPEWRFIKKFIKLLFSE
jgi:hypothetical protein